MNRPIDPAAVGAAFARLARRPEAPWLHREVARRMASRLDVIRAKPDAIVDWWAHAGGSAAVLADAYPQARRRIVEPDAALRAASAASLANARRPWWSRRGAPPSEVLAGDPPAGDAGLLWSNMTLHATADPAAVFARWHRALAVGGFAMFSCFGPDTGRELRALYRRLGWGPPGIGFVDMHDLGDMLVHAGFADPVMDQESLTLTWAAPDALLAELRTLGGNAAPDRFAGLRTPRWRDRLCRELLGQASSGGRVALTFEIVYGHAFKAAPRAPLGAETAVSLDAMRAMVRAPR